MRIVGEKIPGERSAGQDRSPGPLPCPFHAHLPLPSADDDPSEAFRDVEIGSEQNFQEFHNAIKQAFGFTGDRWPAST